MTNPLMTVTPVAKLYPPNQPAEINLILSTLGGGERDRDRRLILPRSLRSPERAALQTRRDVLLPWLTTGRSGTALIKAVVAAMMQGFAAKAMTSDEANMVYVQYSYALRDIPAWAVERACMRFASGSVQPEDVGAKRLDLTWGPSSAQIAVIARSLVQPLHRELQVIGDILLGVVAVAALTPEERKAQGDAIAKMTAETVAAMTSRNLDAQAEESRRESFQRDQARRAVEARRRDYVDAGLVPPTGDSFTSLPMMLRAGWRIEDGPQGRRCLVRSHSMDRESGLDDRVDDIGAMR